jgi:Zn-dependent metalloprotease
VFNRSSYDNKGTPVYNLVYLNNDENKSVYATAVCNAFALANIDPKLMMFGMGGYEPNSQKMKMKPVVDLSVMSHEFTHLVTGNTAKLEYLGESGAIDESFSDMMGISVKKYVKGNDVKWYIGADVMVDASNMRNLAEPKNSGDDALSANPDTYNGMFWFDTSYTTEEYDYGGVHVNLGVGNKWYYLTSDGGEGMNDDSFMYNVKGIGIEKARQIAYRAMTVYATRQTKYADFRKATLQAAKDLYGANGQEVKTVADAWDAVGVLENGVYPSAITNVRRDMQTDDRYYDLQGRPVSQPGKGIYIYKGKKLIKY